MVSFSRRIVRILEETGAVELDVLLEASQVASKGERSVTQHLLDKEVIEEGELLGILADRLNVPPIDLDRVTPSDEAKEAVPAELARKTRCLPLSKIGDQLTVAVGNPFDVVHHDDLRIQTGCELRLALCLDHRIGPAIDRLYGGADSEKMAAFLADVDGISTDIPKVEQETEVVDVSSLGEGEEAPVVKIVNHIIYQAVKTKASDIHVEPFEKRVRVRYRIDGALLEGPEPPKTMQNAVISRLKIMAQLDIAERRKPQDGKFQVRAEGRTIDFRVSTLPTVHGEKVVMRILDSSNLALSLDTLGFEEKALKDFRDAIASPYGMILVTGPTGSGKTTTLYSAVKEIFDDESNFVTVEDPVEYQMDRINQVQVNPKGGLTFSAALRSILRQDPDVVMLGEIRDRETIDIAIKAALTGHLVLSTLHTNDAASTISRMVDMGVDPFMVASATLLVSAQRLIRRLCKHCKKPFEAPEERLLQVGFTPEEISEGVQLMQPKGCSRCSQGYAGRFALLETLPMTESIKRMVVAGRSAVDIRRQALENGMVSLRRAALNNAIRGNTSIEEVLRVTMGEMD
ncbi:MAG: GspE/PulE family protein [Planctomycetota bacterium]